MKRFITVLSSLLVLPAFAEVAPVYYDEIVEYTDDMIDAEDYAAEEETQQSTQKQNVAQRNTINRSTSASRAISAATQTNSRANVSSRAIASSPRTASSTTARGTVSRTTRTNTVVNRTPSTVSRTSVTARGANTSKPVTARVGTSNNSVMTGNRLSTSASQRTLTDSGNALYNPNSVRVGVSNRRTGARISTSTLTSTAPVITEEDISETTTNLTAIAELTDYCKAQYAACMDNYCNVLDDNQGRCSCSKNLKNYAKTEEALAKATEDFQEAVQKIKYIGLTGSQIEALFAETEAEISMKSNSDSSRLKNSLDSIKKKIVDVSTPSSSSTELTSGLSLDLNGLLSADFTAGFDLNSFLGTTNKATSSVSNQRGEQLYKTATNRCKTAVLNSCTAQGIDANVITNSYDLEIDRQCITYERSLNEANTEMKNNVINATNILQQARLLLTQNKNSYDLRGCVAAIDSCMQDEYVCGADYELCLDPTGKYLANGEIVKGGTPGVSGGQTKNPYPTSLDSTAGENATTGLNNWKSGGMYFLYSTWNYGNDSNAWSMGQNENLGGYIDSAMNDWKSNYASYKDSTKTNNMALYLLQKVGYIDGDDKVHGMCASVMKQCQDYTFNSQKSNKKYIPANEVVRQYLVNTLAKIKVQQDAILSDYAEGCRADVQSCLSTNGYDTSNTNSTISKTAVNACASEIATCMSVGGYTSSEGSKLTLRTMTDWVSSMLSDCPTNYYLSDDGEGHNGTTGTKAECRVCPTVDVVDTSKNAVSDTHVKTESAGGQSTKCYCPEGYNDYYPENDDGYIDMSISNLQCQETATTQANRISAIQAASGD